ncbi:hypothetical protein SAICODRAFT_159975 [Saitoella complicata NRRL Y-17804]|uniref:uncharacterized protein n=1 Tax=Saitoella complicata (strain BCRC 22490 / CBS 7301 / JCM 7358 / NBRC 10748 / NRRL Y-17804) TaxID=698492 RepID=UPI0008680294|nr:uncharacterized protein SAICODRAFT_159975 [Saitoella complicata NRRL Y-17804]ODQ50952.1 hypothetical protein SAICODRAFT_159975 [Saitoella complicata NRRL Y-17804]
MAGVMTWWLYAGGVSFLGCVGCISEDFSAAGEHARRLSTINIGASTGRIRTPPGGQSKKLQLDGIAAATTTTQLSTGSPVPENMSSPLHSHN